MGRPKIRLAASLSTDFAPTPSQLAAGALVVEVHGELDTTNSFDVRERLLASVWDGCGVMVVDLTQCGFLDSRGLGCLIEASHRLVEEGGAFAIVCPEAGMGPSRILRVAGVTDHLPVLESRAAVDAAVASARVTRLAVP
jgi:anti-anti-sigma factor